MATDQGCLAATGNDCEFVKKPPNEIQADCPICLLVLREPLQLECCGSACCEACINKVLDERGSCPTCNELRPKTFRDKRLKQTLSGFHVYCIHRDTEKQGCEWVGELGDLDRHINANPSAENPHEGCQFTEVKCKFCQERIQRVFVKHHQMKDCPKRDYTCSSCDYQSTYIDVTENHFLVCPLFLTFCPHCVKEYHRRDLEYHIEKECPVAPVSCVFGIVGCPENLPKLEMAAHLQESHIGHTRLLQKYLTEHLDHTVGEYLPLLASSFGTVVDMQDENMALKLLVKRQSQELRQMRAVQLVLILAMFLLLLVLAVLCSRGL